MKHYVYRAYDDAGVLLYVGCTSNLPRRMREWARSSAAWTWRIRSMVIDHYSDHLAAVLAERSIIWREVPRFNVQHNVLNRRVA